MLKLMGKALIIAVLFVWAVAAEAGNPYEAGSALVTQNQIDTLVMARLQQLKIPPSNLCSDAVFVRRVYLDVIGTLPTEQEAREFLDSKDPSKRKALIEKLLSREEFVDYWTTKWCDLLRVKAEFPINLWPNAAQAYHHWIRASLKQNKPYDRFVRELLTGNGSNFREASVNFYRAMQNKTPDGIAQSVALTFMGTRADKWPKDRLTGLTAFFTHHSGPTQFVAEEQSRANEYHELQADLKANNAKVQAFVNTWLAICKAKGQVLTMDATGDPGCATETPKVAPAAAAGVPDQKAIGLRGSVTVPKK